MNLAKNFAIPAAIATTLSFAPVKNADAGLILQADGDVTTLSGPVAEGTTIFFDGSANDNLATPTAGTDANPALNIFNFAAGVDDTFKFNIGGQEFFASTVTAIVRDNDALGTDLAGFGFTDFDALYNGTDEILSIGILANGGGLNFADDSFISGFSASNNGLLELSSGSVRFDLEADAYTKMTPPPTSVSEPATVAILGLGLLGIAGARRKFAGNNAQNNLDYNL